MAKTTECNKGLTVLSVKVAKSLGLSLKKSAQQDCRTLREEAVYFLEVMSAVSNRQPKLMLRREYAESMSVLTGHIKVEVPSDLYDSLFHRAGEYGLRLPELVRLWWLMALDFRDKLALKNQMLTKEDFIETILKKLQKQRVH